MNYTKTFLLLASMTALFCLAGYALGGQGGMMFAFLFALITNLGSYWYSDKIVLSMYKAQEITSGPLVTMVQELASKASLPMPKVYTIDSPQPNAFATGRDPEHGAVAVTTGILSLLTQEELAGVLAHELGHIKNRDTLIMTITATIAGALGMLANMMMFTGHRQEGRGGLSIIVMILAPIAAILVQMAISRTREYSADRAGAEISGTPLALASALRKLQQGTSRIDNDVAEQNPATAHMFIMNPLHAHATDNLFSTHPSTDNRIRALQEMAGETFPSEAGKRQSPWG